MEISCLAFANFEQRVCAIFHDLADKKEFSDVTLACEGKQIQSHKVVLSAVSPILRALLKQNRHEHPIIFLRGVKYSQMVQLLDFIYKGQVNIPQIDVGAFLEMASDLQIEGLTAATEQQVGEDLEEGEVGNLSKRRRTETHEYTDDGDSNGLLDPHGLIKEEPCLMPNDNDTHLSHVDMVEDYNGDAMMDEEGYLYNQDMIMSNFNPCKRILACDRCTRTFKTRHNLKQHIKAVHEKVRYDCDQCNHKASTKSNLRIHKESQHEGIKYDCDECEYTTTIKSRLKKHKETKHETPLALLLKKTEEEFKSSQQFSQHLKLELMEDQFVTSHSESC